MDWSPGVLGKSLERVGAHGEANTRRAVAELAAAVERAAKEATRETSHQRGTPTPAPRGGPPALITGSLSRSIVRTDLVSQGLGQWSTKVGMAAGVYPPASGGRQGRDAQGHFTNKSAGKRGTTTTSKYAFYLETVIGFPFLLPSYRRVIDSESSGIFASAFRFWG